MEVELTVSANLSKSLLLKGSTMSLNRQIATKPRCPLDNGLFNNKQETRLYELKGIYPFNENFVFQGRCSLLVTRRRLVELIKSLGQR